MKVRVRLRGYNHSGLSVSEILRLFIRLAGCPSEILPVMSLCLRTDLGDAGRAAETPPPSAALLSGINQ